MVLRDASASKKDIIIRRGLQILYTNLEQRVSHLCTDKRNLMDQVPLVTSMADPVLQIGEKYLKPPI